MRYCPCDASVPRTLAEFETRFDVQGHKRVFVMRPFPERVCFAREFLAAAGGSPLASIKPDYVQIGDGIVTIICANARASYGLDAENLQKDTVCGVRSAVPREDNDEVRGSQG